MKWTNLTLCVPCIILQCINVTLCVPCIILQCVNDQRDAQFLYSILFHNFCLLYMFRKNLVVHHQEHSIMYCITQFGTIGTLVLSGESSCFAVLVMMKD